MSTGGHAGSDLRKVGRSLGDLGDVAVAVRSQQRTLNLGGAGGKRLTVRGVFGSLQTIAAESGSGSQDRKKQHIKKMIVLSKGVEVKYVVRTLEANLRVGATLKTVLAALAHAIVLTPPASQSPVSPAKSSASSAGRPAAGGVDRKAVAAEMAAAAKALREAWDRHPDLGHIVGCLLAKDGGWRELERVCPVTTGVPVEPMLGQITSSFDGMANEAAGGRRFACEVKYDGQRAQVCSLTQRTGLRSHLNGIRINQ